MILKYVLNLQLKLSGIETVGTSMDVGRAGTETGRSTDVGTAGTEIEGMAVVGMGRERDGMSTEVGMAGTETGREGTATGRETEGTETGRETEGRAAAGVVGASGFRIEDTSPPVGVQSVSHRA